MKKKIVLFNVIVISFVFICNSIAYQFTGTGSRWPSAQTKSIVTATIKDNEYIFTGDGDTINVFASSNLNLINYTRLPIKKGEGILSLVYYEDKKKLYAACGAAGIHIINVNNPENPTIENTPPVIPSIHLTETDEKNGKHLSDINALDLDITGEFLFVADNDYGIRIFHLAGQGTPEDRDITGLRLPKSSVRNIAIYQSCAVILTNTSIMYFPFTIDNDNTVTVALAGPSTAIPSLVGASSLWMHEGFAYCTDQLNNHLYIFNLSEAIPENKPALIYPKTGNDYLAFGQPRGLYIRGNYAYIASFYPKKNVIDSLAGLHIVDISKKSKPLDVPGAVYNLDYANSIAVSGNFAYISSLKDGLHKIDISTPENLSEEQNNGNSPIFLPQRTKLNAAEVVVAHEHAFVTDKLDGDEFGFAIINVDNPFHPYFEKFVPTPGKAHSIYINSGFTFGYIADGTKGIQVMTFGSGQGQGLANPTISPNPIKTPKGVSVISVSGSDASPFLLAITDEPEAKLWINDMTDPLSPGLSTIVNVPEAKKVHAFESYAFVAAGSNGIKIFKIWEDKSAKLLSTVLIDISDETNYDDVTAVCTGTVTGGRTDSVGGSSNNNDDVQYAFIADTANGVHILDIFSDASNFSPKEIATIDTSEYGNAKDLKFSDNHLYIMTDNNKNAILIFDISDINKPVFKDSSESNGVPSGLFVYDVNIEDTSMTPITMRKIKAAYLAEGPAYLSIKDVSNDKTDNAPRNWTNNTEMLCLISSVRAELATKTSMMPVFIFLFSCFILVCFFSLVIKIKKDLNKKKINL